MIQLQICNIIVFQRELDEVARMWDCHRMQRHRNMIAPCGKPIIMYTSPELYNAEDKLVAVDALDVEVCIDQCLFKRWQPCRNSSVFEFCCHLMVENHLEFPSNAREGIILYSTLRELIYNEL